MAQVGRSDRTGGSCDLLHAGDLLQICEDVEMKEQNAPQVLDMIDASNRQSTGPMPAGLWRRGRLGQHRPNRNLTSSVALQQLSHPFLDVNITGGNVHRTSVRD